MLVTLRTACRVVSLISESAAVRQWSMCVNRGQGQNVWRFQFSERTEPGLSSAYRSGRKAEHRERLFGNLQ